MKTQVIGFLAILALITTSFWLFLLISDISQAGPLDTWEQMLAHVSQLSTLHYLAYTNAALTVIINTLLLAGLYTYLRPSAPEWSAIAIVFVPVYAVINLIVYLAQITIVPSLLGLMQQPQYHAAAELMLRLWVQEWSGSGASLFNNLAYAILGIPSIIFGILLIQRNHSLGIAGALLALNGVACMIGIGGILAHNAVLGAGSVVGGGLYLLALIPLSAKLVRQV